MKRIFALDFIRVFAIFCVIVEHMLFLYHYEPEDKVL